MEATGKRNFYEKLLNFEEKSRNEQEEKDGIFLETLFKEIVNLNGFKHEFIKFEKFCLCESTLESKSNKQTEKEETKEQKERIYELFLLSIFSCKPLMSKHLFDFTQV